MNCRYCGAGLPSQGGVCPNCGRMIPMDQQKEMKQILDPKWNQFRSKDTALYKKESNTDNDAKIGKYIIIIIAIIIILIIIGIVKGMN